MKKKCDNKSVGQIIQRGNDFVLIERRNYPKSYALPAGHLDGNTSEVAVAKESEEEAGIKIVKNKLIWEGRIDNPCKREGGSRHYWYIYKATEWTGEVKAGDDAKEAYWVSLEKLKSIARRTEYFMKKYNIDYRQVGDLTKAVADDLEWQKDMGLEPVWYFILTSLKII